MHKCNPKGSLAEVWRNRTSDDSEFLQEISLEGCFVRAGGFSPTLNFTWSVVWHSKLICWTESWKIEALVGLTQPLNLSHDLIFLCLQLQHSNYSDSGWLYLLLLADIERSSCDRRLMCLWKASPEPDLGELFLLLLRMDLALFSSAVHQLCPVGCSFYNYQFLFCKQEVLLTAPIIPHCPGSTVALERWIDVVRHLLLSQSCRKCCRKTACLGLQSFGHYEGILFS